MAWSSIFTNPAVGSVLGVGDPYEQNIEFAFDSTGLNGVIAWAETGEKSMARRLVNGVWQSAETLWPAEAQTHRVVCAFIDDSGAPCVALSRGSWYFATLHRYASGSWSQVSSEFGGSGGAATGVDFPTSSEPVVCLPITYGGTNNRSLALFFKSRDGLRVARQVNGTWQTTALLGSTLFGATVGGFIKVSNTEWHAIGRLQDNRVAHWKTTDSGANWTAATIISNADNLASDVRASLLSDGSILAVWSKTTGSGATAWARLSSGTWSSPAEVTGPGNAITTGNVNFAAGTLTYGKTVSGVTQVCAKTFASGAWGSETQLTTEASNITHHSFNATTGGEEAALAYQAGTSFKIRRRVYGSWRTAQTFSGSNFWPQVASNSVTLGVHSGLTPQALTLDVTIPQQLTGYAEMVGTSSILSGSTEEALSAFTDSYETALGNALLRNTPLQGPETIYAALFTSPPSDAGTGGTEVSGNGYARTAITFGAPSTAGVFTNSASCLFPEASASWGVITHIGLMSAATGGSVIIVVPLRNAQGGATTATIGQGDRPEIGTAALTVQVT